MLSYSRIKLFLKGAQKYRYLECNTFDQAVLVMGAQYIFGKVFVFVAETRFLKNFPKTGLRNCATGMTGAHARNVSARGADQMYRVNIVSKSAFFGKWGMLGMN